MTLLNFLLPLILITILAACTADVVESEPEAEPQVTVPPLREITPEEPTSIPEPSMESSPAEPTPTSTTHLDPTDDDTSTATGSGSASPAEVDLSEITSEPPANTTPVVMPEPGVPDHRGATAHQISQDLAERLGVDVSEVETISIEDVEWSDSSIGCPSPDMMYASVITPGYLITFDVHGEKHTAHTDLQGNHLFCGEDGQPVDL